MEVVFSFELASKRDTPAGVGSGGESGQKMAKI